MCIQALCCRLHLKHVHTIVWSDASHSIPWLLMCAGVLLAAPIVTAAIVFLAGLEAQLYMSAAAGPGILSGAIWNAGNICSIVATNDPQVGLSIAYPIMQCGLLVAGLWGIFTFRELQGRAVVVWGMSGLVVVVGASMLTLSK